MKYTIQVLESVTEIENGILSQLSEILEMAIMKSVPEIDKNIKLLVSSSLQSEPEYLSLISGELRYNFGIPDVSVVDKIIELITDTLNITINKITHSSQGLNGGLTITMLGGDDLTNIIKTDFAQVNDNVRGYNLPWLEWLLLRNNEVIINNYDVKLGPSPASRTGNAIMVKSKNSWRVPTAFAGSAENNWVSRSLQKIDEDIVSVITKAISNQL